MVDSYHQLPKTPRRRSRQARQKVLLETVEKEPLLTDEELARRLDVSVATIRLDRLALGIPDVRERTRRLAAGVLDKIRTLHPKEVVGEIVDMEMGSHALSLLEVSPAMAFLRSGHVRGQYLYAQAESLALAVVDEEQAVASVVNVKFKGAVRVGEKVVAQARVLRQPRPGEWVVLVESKSGGRPVFRGKFLIREGE
ncbi:MAG: transcription factor FapR [Clostridiales bacterium]|nr:transcription factor FapR [Clostridiales bacterium]